MQTLVKPTHTKLQTNDKNVIKKYQYDRTFVLSELRSLVEELHTNTEIKSKAQLFRNRTYSYSRFNGWRAKYEGNANIHELLKKIEEILESRLVEQGLAGKSIPMTIFLLKNYYGYTDQYQTKVDTSVTFKVNRGTKVIDVTPK